MTRTEQLGSVDNALRLLCLFRDRPTVGVAEASSALGIGRSTAHRLLTTLAARGFVTQDTRIKTYKPGPTLLDVALSGLRGLELRSVARPELEALRDEVQETVHLLVIDGTSTSFVDSVETRRTLRTTSRIGVTLPTHATSGGKAVLAELTAEELRALYPNQRLPSMTARTIATRRALELELANVRRRGYAVNLGESEPDVNAVGAAIRAEGHGPDAAIAISGPSTRLTDARIEQLGAAARGTAANIAVLIRQI